MAMITVEVNASAHWHHLDKYCNELATWHSIKTHIYIQIGLTYIYIYIWYVQCPRFELKWLYYPNIVNNETYR